MLIYHFIYYFIHLQMSLASVPPSNIALWPSSNVSFSAGLPNNYSLGAWPPRVPWASSRGDLTLVVWAYGRDATPAMSNSIRDGLTEVRQSINDWGFNTKRSGWLFYRTNIEIRIYTEDNTLVELPSTGAGVAIKMIEDFFFIYKDGPRELDVEVIIPTRPSLLLQLRWTDTRDNWPEILPWELTRSGDFVAEVEFYGKDLNQSSSGEVEEDMDTLVGTIVKGSQIPNFMSRKSYSHGLVTLTLEGPPNSGDDPKSLSRFDFYLVIVGLLSYRDHNPRELGVYLKRNGEVIAQVFLLYTSLD